MLLLNEQLLHSLYTTTGRLALIHQDLIRLLLISFVYCCQMINHICMCTVFIYYVYIYIQTHTVYIFETFIFILLLFYII